MNSLQQDCWVSVVLWIGTDSGKDYEYGLNKIRIKKGVSVRWGFNWGFMSTAELYDSLCGWGIVLGVTTT